MFEVGFPLPPYSVRNRRGLKVSLPAYTLECRRIATFSAVHADVGDLKIYDEDVELTVEVGNLTHGHFSPRNYEAPQAEREGEVIEQVMAFLEAVFDDQIEFWRTDIEGGWGPRGSEPIGPNPRKYTWSGPLSAASPKWCD